MRTEHKVDLSSIELGGVSFFKLANVDAMRPFFMSIVSDSEHWMFLSSNGGLTAGRKNAEYALFPYYTDDRITADAPYTGSKTILRGGAGDDAWVWEPWSDQYGEKYKLSRNLYKSVLGNTVIFEEINHSLQLGFRYQWSTSQAYGFVRTATVTNYADEDRRVEVLDGIQNIMPAGVNSALQSNTSNLVDAYKRSELEPGTGLGIFALSAIIVDKAEPSEALKANTVFALGLPDATRLLSSRQLEAFRRGVPIHQEEDVKAEKGAYFVNAPLTLASQQAKSWHIVADVNQDHASILQLMAAIPSGDALALDIAQDIAAGTEKLSRLIAAADGVQCSGDAMQDARHLSNVLFNIMRGGIFDDNYKIEKQDFEHYLAQANQPLFERQQVALGALPPAFELADLKQWLQQITDADLLRLATEYLPLKFSRRHGDPSRPWNKFSINLVRVLDGAKILDYQGNWRDIFQNWEALAHAYPAFIEGMVFKFLNASTFDGYNPYRVTKGGFDWETIEPDDPWSYIGYWGDHQIIYLLKLLEFAQSHDPAGMQNWWGKDCFVYANVPYKIKPYREICQNPKDTIDFDFALDETIRHRQQATGADGALLPDANGNLVRVNFAEKLMATLLAKLSNYIPDGGIWMNTQRPEWNDANNALVGNGVSVVTLCYLLRFVRFLERFLETAQQHSIALSEELAAFLSNTNLAFANHATLLDAPMSTTQRKAMMDALGQAGSQYRWHIYEQAFSGRKATISSEELQQFLGLVKAFLTQTIAANERPDGLYHGYNLVELDAEGASVDHLYEMLEGQVAVLSSGYLTPEQSIGVLDALRKSAMYRTDQQSYLLYPNTALPGFLQKNTIAPKQLAQYGLLQKADEADFATLLVKDLNGNYHFNGNFKNAGDLRAAMAAVAALNETEQAALLGLFEEVFRHKAFTGRSGTFYGYEGLGSIYWHMVSKLRLAVFETYQQAKEGGADENTLQQLRAHYHEITAGIGVHKHPQVYGAFPTDPYSHTPQHKGAQQPGMTGQVKEDILSRWGELGVQVRDGKLHFIPTLIREEEWLKSPATVRYFDVHGQEHTVDLPAQSLFFSCCQVPVTYQRGGKKGTEISYRNGSSKAVEGYALDEADTREIVQRSGSITGIAVYFDA